MPHPRENPSLPLHTYDKGQSWYWTLTFDAWGSDTIDAPKALPLVEAARAGREAQTRYTKGT